LYGTARRIIASSTTRLWAFVRYSTARSRQFMASSLCSWRAVDATNVASSPSSSAW
jgi:hypothetical protein